MFKIPQEHARIAALRSGALREAPGLVTVYLALTLLRQAAGMKQILLCLSLALTACGAQPAPEFFAAQRADVSRDGRSYTVFYTAKRVEVIRLGHAPRGTHQDIRATMIELIPRVTGCTLRESTLQGDSGEMRGSVSCPKQP